MGKIDSEYHNDYDSYDYYDSDTSYYYDDYKETKEKKKARKKQEKQIKREEQKKRLVNTFPKFVLLLVELHGMACVTASYVLAFINHTTVENLSITIVGQIVSPLIAYILGNVVSNVFEKNKLSFSTPLAAIESGTVPVSEPIITQICDTSDATILGTVEMPIDLNAQPDDINNVDLGFEFGNISGKGNE